ncbi:hypothetical protein V6N13_031598 [Hibiscus sabdariffa]
MSRQATFTEYITEEILLEIFYRLPAKSLGKCMCVSKAWNFLIKNPFFVSSHAIHQSKLRCRNNKNLFFVMTGRHQVEYSLHLDDLEFKRSELGYFGIQGKRTYVSSFTESLVLHDQPTVLPNFLPLVKQPMIRVMSKNLEAVNSLSKREGLQLRTGK